MNAARPLRARLVVWVVLGCGVVAALHLGKAAIATPLLQADLGVDLAGAGWLTGIFAVLGLLGERRPVRWWRQSEIGGPCC